MSSLPPKNASLDPLVGALYFAVVARGAPGRLTGFPSALDIAWLFGVKAS